MPKYRLQALLEIRERAEEEAKEAFAMAMKALEEEKQRLREEEKRLEEMIADRERRRAEYARKLASGEMKVSDQAGAYRFIDRLKEKELDQKGVIDAAHEAVREAEKFLKRAQDALITATQDLKALQKHKEKWQEQLKKERQMKEEDNLDEIAQTIYQQRMRNQ